MGPGDNISRMTVMCLHGSIIYLSDVNLISLDGFGMIELDPTRISRSVLESQKLIDKLIYTSSNLLY